jgi:glycosyltransferase involved in cell wall biosynthesis
MDDGRRILFVLDHFYPYVGGGETLFRELTAALVTRGWQVTVLTLREPGTQREEVREAVRIVRVTTPPIARRYWFILLSLAPALRLAATADIVHAAGYASAWAGWLAGWWWRRPVVLTVFEVFANQWLALQDVPAALGRLYRFYERLALQLPFDRFLCISRFTRDRLAKFVRVPTERMVVVYPAVDYSFWRNGSHRARDLTAELGLREGAFLYIYFGRPGVSKGVDFLVEAVRLARDRLSNIHLLLLLSRDPPRGYQRILQLIGELHLQDGVTVLDPVPRPELPSYLLAADCVVIPSLSEGFGYTAIEAASLGCRVVATQGHAVEEVLGDYAILAPARDPNGLANALVEAALSRRKVEPLARDYSVEKHVEETLAVYHGLVQRGTDNGS